MFQLWSSVSISGHDSSELVLQPRAQLQLGSQVSMFLRENVDLRRQRPNRSPLQCLSLFTQPVRFFQSSGTRKVGSGYPTDSTCLYLGLRGQYFEFVHGSTATGSVPLILALGVRPFWVWGSVLRGRSHISTHC